MYIFPVKTSLWSFVCFKNSTHPSCRWSWAHQNEDAGLRASLTSPVGGNKSNHIKLRLTETRAVLVVSSWGGFILYAPVQAPSPWLTLSSLYTSPPLTGVRPGLTTNIVKVRLLNAPKVYDSHFPIANEIHLSYLLSQDQNAAEIYV